MQTYMNGLMDYSNQRMTKELQKLLDGRWEFEDYLESDGQTEQQIPIHCKITLTAVMPWWISPVPVRRCRVLLIRPER